MIEGQISRTAIGAAAHRAVHQLVDGGRIFADPLAVPILGADLAERIAEAEARPLPRSLRFFIAARSAFAEAKLAEAVERSGVGQYVLLGAGLDTFGCRNPFGERLRAFEVDHPATQAWKRHRLEAAGIAVPPTLTFVGVDFERAQPLDRLVEAGFDPERPAVFAWLGTVPYLSRAAISATLAMISGLAGGAGLVFDYAEPVEARSDLAERVAAAGEPLLSLLEPAALHDDLRGLGFTAIEDLTVPDLIARHFGEEEAEARAEARKRGGHLLFASNLRT
ncbi:MAG TPA: class I SAM-dependent methyltransferase [Allosphingosinicella sp.]|nr:class I SAM-dependent methyltransferase [Allosphingosinicella sp.]